MTSNRSTNLATEEAVDGCTGKIVRIEYTDASVTLVGDDNANVPGSETSEELDEAPINEADGFFGDQSGDDNASSERVLNDSMNDPISMNDFTPRFTNGKANVPIFRNDLDFMNLLAIWKTVYKIKNKYISELLKLLKQLRIDKIDLANLPLTCETLLKRTSASSQRRVLIRQICRKPAPNKNKRCAINLSKRFAQILGYWVYLGILNGFMDNGPGNWLD